jgi:flagellar basal-body rod protein FlgF
MANGMWTAASGASAQAQNLETIANNLANADTPAFKKDITTFKEYLSKTEREQDPKDIPRGEIKDKDFYPIEGKDQSFVVVDGTHANFKQGHLKVTQSQFDLALDGPGFLEINTPFGLRYTRHGNLKVTSEGRLVTNEGYPLMSAQSAGLAQEGANQPLAPNPNPAARFINLRDRGPRFTISAQGEIYSGEFCGIQKSTKVKKGRPADF